MAVVIAQTAAGSLALSQAAGQLAILYGIDDKIMQALSDSWEFLKIFSQACVWGRDWGLVEALKTRQELSALFFIKVGANVHQTDQVGKTLLMHFSISGYVSVVKALLEKNACVHQTDREGRSALNWATRLYWDSVWGEWLKHFLQKKEFNEEKMPAIAKRYKTIIETLLRRGADPKDAYECGGSALFWTPPLYRHIQGHEKAHRLLERTIYGNDECLRKKPFYYWPSFEYWKTTEGRSVRAMLDEVSSKPLIIAD